MQRAYFCIFRCIRISIDEIFDFIFNALIDAMRKNLRIFRKVEFCNFCNWLIYEFCEFYCVLIYSWKYFLNNFNEKFAIFFALFDSTSIATSSIKLKILMFAYLCLFFILENKNRIYIEDEINEINDLCEISVRIARVACFFYRMLIWFFDQSWMI